MLANGIKMLQTAESGNLRTILNPRISTMSTTGEKKMIWYLQKQHSSGADVVTGRLQFVLVMKFLQVEAVFRLSSEVWVVVVKLWSSIRGL
jgi:hypothetical protein